MTHTRAMCRSGWVWRARWTYNICKSYLKGVDLGRHQSISLSHCTIQHEDIFHVEEVENQKKWEGWIYEVTLKAESKHWRPVCVISNFTMSCQFLTLMRTQLLRPKKKWNLYSVSQALFSAIPDHHLWGLDHTAHEQLWIETADVLPPISEPMNNCKSRNCTHKLLIFFLI